MGKAFGVIFGLTLTFLIDCLVIKLLWNYLATVGFWTLHLTYVQTMALRVLFNLLFKSNAKKS